MSKRLKYFLAVLIISIPFWLGVNYLKVQVEGFTFAKEILKNPPEYFLADISSKVSKKKSPDFSLSAESAFCLKVTKEGEEVLLDKNSKLKTPIASLTKTMTAIVASEFYEPNKTIKISQKAVNQKEAKGMLTSGEKWRVKNLLEILLIESSNDAAFALAEGIGFNAFVDLMNLKTKSIGLKNTHWTNPTGLDKEDSFAQETGISTAEDVLKVTKYLIKEKPKLLEIMEKSEKEIRLNGVFHHIAYNTNELLKAPLVLGGKTGYTGEAGECLLLIMKKDSSYYLSVVLNSEDRFKDMLKIVKYVNSLTY